MEKLGFKLSAYIRSDSKLRFTAGKQFCVQNRSKLDLTILHAHLMAMLQRASNSRTHAIKVSKETSSISPVNVMI